MRSNNNPIFDSVRTLLAQSLDGTIQPFEAHQLDGLLCENADARRYYLELIHLHLGLRRISEKKAASLCCHDESVLDQRLWEELARSELMAEPAEVAVSKQPRDRHYDAQAVVVKPVPMSARVNKWAFYTALISTAALMCVVCYLLLLPPVPPIVATLTDAMHCQWADAGKTVATGQDVRAEPHTLLSGVLTLRFDSGAEVVIEGPAEFAPLTTNKMLLTSGKAFAQVPPTSIGFTIDTPQSSVVDLGTAFGVSVVPDYSSEVHVHDGKVNLIVGQAGNTRESEIITQHEARKVDVQSGDIFRADFQRYLFVQGIDSKKDRLWYGPPVCLADVVAGGDGFSNTGPSQGGIDPATGKIHLSVQRDFGREGSGQFQPIAERPFIDGVFVPNGPTEVSSAGHTCQAFGPTAGTFWSDITTWPMIHHVALNEDGEVLFEQQLSASLVADTAAGRRNVPRILTHSNSGITFDLDRIRQSTRAEIASFRADCGISFNTMARMRQELWVLLDGQVAYRHRFSEAAYLPQEIEVSIRPEHRFLTLAATDGGDGTSFDWGIFERPILELAKRSVK